jgi:hypothetical protein
MAHPDHDQVIGSLVAARLRGAATRATAAEPCPDAETWAAYVDGGLLPAEASHLEAHLVACPTCRRLVAALVPEGATLETPAEAPAATGGAVVLPFPRRQVWTWMAAAAGVLMAVTLWSVSRLSQTPETRTADSAAATTAPAEALVPPPAPTADPRAGGAAAPPATAAGRARELARTEASKPTALADDRDRRANATGGDASARAGATAPAAGRETEAQAKTTEERARAAEAKRSDAPRQQANAQVNVVRPHGPLAPTNQQATQQANQQPSQQASQTAPPAGPQAETAQFRAGQAPATSPPAAPPPATAAAPAPAPAPAPATPPAAADAVSGQRAAGLAKARPARATASPDNERKEEKDKADAAAAARGAGALTEAVTITTGPTLPAFAEPAGRLRWRIADNGRRIESSSDGGTTWNSRYRAPRGERLRAGSAPDLDSAWVVGDRGLVLRRAVPGEWQAVTRVENLALTGVSASGATTARVTAADGRVFETRDGGATWTPAGAGASPP